MTDMKENKTIRGSLVEALKGKNIVYNLVYNVVPEEGATYRDILAATLLCKAMNGDVDAIKVIFDRVEGKTKNLEPLSLL